MKPVKVYTKCDLKKPVGYINRNWPKASIKIKEKAEARAAERAAALAAKEARIADKLARQAKNNTNSLEKSPMVDCLDISSEEEGFFKIGNKVFETIFPR